MTAILDIKGDKPLNVRPGDTVRGMRVASIREKAIVLVSKHGVWTLTQQARDEEKNPDTPGNSDSTSASNSVTTADATRPAKKTQDDSGD